MLSNLLQATLAEKMGNGAFTFILGICVIFLGMIILVISVSLVGKAVSSTEEKKVAKPKKEVEVKPEPAPVVSVSDDDIPEDVKVAIIAAISAYYLSGGPTAKPEFTVRKIKKI